VDCYPGRKLYHLEHGNFCAESKCQCDSLRHDVYLRFLLHRAAERPCYGRLLQDRFAYDGCDPGTNGNWHANSHAYSQLEPNVDADAYGNFNTNTYAYPDANSYGHSYTDVNTNSDCDSNSNSNSYSYCYAYSYCYSYGYAYGHCDCYCYTDAYFHTKTNPDAKRYGFAKASADSAASPVVKDEGW
jgi:hypothetical protein